MEDDRLGFWERNGYHTGAIRGARSHSVDEYVARTMRRKARERGID